MARPVNTVVQMPYQNPHASAPLIIPVLVVCNTPDDELYRNIELNSARELPWLYMRPAHEKVAVMCGGGPSLVDHLPEIKALQAAGGVVFAMNAASQFLRSHGIAVDHQVIADAKPETASLVDPEAWHHLMASQVDAQTVERAERVTLWHLAIDEAMDRLFPMGRRQAGGYALVGGGAAVGNSALCVAYVLGFRTFEIYGYDSSHRGDDSHAYPQPMNQFIPTVNVEWAGKTYLSSYAMKAQAEKFQFTAQALRGEGCTLNVHGEGLLPAMWNTDASQLTERDKYRLMWSTDGYRENSPGEGIVPTILEVMKPHGLVIDFGCGTGRAALELSKAGCDVLLIDFADNARDEEAMGLPFLEWDLTRSLPPHAEFGICTDVMEHIPTEDVDTVLRNVTDAADTVFFQISTVPDHFGDMLDTHLHLTVQPHEWWHERLQRFGEVTFERDLGAASIFLVRQE
jgi:hypothetical protein